MQKQVSPKVTAVLILLTLGVVQLVYWRKLVLRPPPPGPGGGGPMAMPPLGPLIPIGLPQVRVTTFAGEGPPGYKDGDGILARFDGPSAIVADAQGNLFVSDSRNHRIRRITPDGKVSTAAGSGDAGTLIGGFADGPARAARFWSPSGLALHPQKGLYIADTGNHRIRLLTPAGEVKTIAGGDTSRDAIGRHTGGYGDGPGAEARFRFPTGLALDEAGNLYVADTGNHCVRKMTPDGNVTTLARFSTVRATIFVAITDTERTGSSPEPPPQVQAVPTSGENIATPTGLVVDRSGSLIVADAGNQCLWEVAPDGATRVLVPPPLSETEASDATHFLRPTGLTDDGAGGLYVTDTATHCLLHWSRQQGTILLAGQSLATLFGRYVDDTGERAGFATPCALTRVEDEIFIADFGNNCIRKVREGAWRSDGVRE